MRLAYCVVALAVGCAAPAQAPRFRLSESDGDLGRAPVEALAEWHRATGGRYPQRSIVFGVESRDDRLAATSPTGGEDMPWFVTVRPELPPKLLRRALLHELGHVAGLVMDPDSADPAHWHGKEPSIMRGQIDDCADSIGEPELAAFDRKYGR